MKPLKRSIALLCMAIVFNSCNKTIVVVPTACMTLSATNIKLSDTLTVFNCSKAEVVYITIYDSGKALPANAEPQYPIYYFNNNNQLKYNFTSTGLKYVYLTAINRETGAPYEFETLSVRVTP